LARWGSGPERTSVDPVEREKVSASPSATEGAFRAGAYPPIWSRGLSTPRPPRFSTWV
jgi:hypothetical protein